MKLWFFLSWDKVVEFDILSSSRWKEELKGSSLVFFFVPLPFDEVITDVWEEVCHGVLGVETREDSVFWFLGNDFRIYSEGLFRLMRCGVKGVFVKPLVSTSGFSSESWLLNGGYLGFLVLGGQDFGGTGDILWDILRFSLIPSFILFLC